MTLTVMFLVLLVFTAVCMVLTVISGRQARRRAHLVRALVTVVSLVVTVALAYLVAKYERDLPEPEMNVHRVFSTTVAGLVPPVALTGILLWRKPRWRRPHRWCVGLLLLATVGALGTGLWVLLLSAPKSPS